MPAISVIVPVYKAEKYLPQCVETILKQKFSDLELILVDDGSPDRSGLLCDEYAQQDSRVRVIHKENGGVSTARNAGLDEATGDYIAFVDSDDWLDADMYAQMMAKAGEFGCDVIMCDCLKEYPERSSIYTHDIRGGFYDRAALEREYFPHLLMMENVEYPATISNWLLLFRRELAEHVRYISGVRYSEDLLFGAQILYRAQSFFYMKEHALYHYRMNPQSATHRFVPDKWEDYQRLHREITAAFCSCEDFDFKHQIDLCLLFFLYNTAGEITRTRYLDRKEKIKAVKGILRSDSLRDLFSRLKIGKLSIPFKQKLITWLYKKRWAIGLLCMYYERK